MHNDGGKQAKIYRSDDSQSFEPLIDNTGPIAPRNLADTIPENQEPGADGLTRKHVEPDNTQLRSSRNYRHLSISPSPNRQGGNPSDKEIPSSAIEKVTWLSLPRKSQLCVLTLARLSEPLANTSLQSYLYYQLSSFDPSLPPSKIAAQAGLVSASFSAAQAVTSVLWGTVSDAPWGGRKLVIIIGLCGTGFGCLGYGFSSVWWASMLWRMLSGSVNGNVGVMRTMVSEIVKEKKYQSRAFLLLPLCFNIGVIIGPVLGGILADPVSNFPGVFGPGSKIGGKDGVFWMKKWPYSLPNIVSASYLFATAFMVFLFLEETHEALQDKPDIGIQIGNRVKSVIRRLFGRRRHEYSSIPEIDTEVLSSGPDTPLRTGNSIELGSSLADAKIAAAKPSVRYVLPLRKLFTRNVLVLLTSHFIMAMGVGTYNSLWFVFLSTPRFNPSHPVPPTLKEQNPPFHFTGGLGLPPSQIGFATAIIGFVGITLQLVVYPTTTAWLGTLRSYQIALFIFPIVYTITPFLSVVPSSSTPPAPVSGLSVWLAVVGVLSLQSIARTFALPSQTILNNNAVPHRSRLGTLHGVAQSISSIARTFGPIGWLWAYGLGLNKGIVWLAYWGMAICAMLGATVGCFAKEGDDVKQDESEDGLINPQLPR